MGAQPALIILAVNDLPRAVRFYRSAFDWPQEVDVLVYAEFVPGDQRLGLYERGAFRGATRDRRLMRHRICRGLLTGTELYFYPADLPAAIVRLNEASGARIAKRN